MTNRTKTFEINPELWDLDSIEERFHEHNLEYEKTEVNDIDVKYYFPDQQDANKAFEIIYDQEWDRETQSYKAPKHFKGFQNL